MISQVMMLLEHFMRESVIQSKKGGMFFMKTNIVETEKKLETKVEYVQFNENFYLYKIVSFLGKEIIFNRCNICLKEDLENLLNSPESFSKVLPWTLFTAETPEVVRTDFHNFQSNLSHFLIKESSIFDNITELEDFSGYTILKFDYSTDLVYEFGNPLPLPKTMYFGYISGDISNGYYDLKHVLEILEQREDVTIETDKHGNKIQTIPYYNNPNGEGKTISFIWKPTQKDWNIVAADMGKYERYDIVMEKIFGLKKERK